MAKLVLKKGAFKGQTVNLRGYKFVNGELPLVGTLVQNEGLIRYMEICYQAELVATPQEIDDGERDLQTQAQPGRPEALRSDIRPDGNQPSEKTADVRGGHAPAEAGTTGSVADGDGHEDTGLHSQIRKALTSLDQSNDAHWTRDGKPSCDAVASLMNSGNVTRAQIEAASPGFRRKTA
jgi:hypothetical protein